MLAEVLRSAKRPAHFELRRLRHRGMVARKEKQVARQNQVKPDRNGTMEPAPLRMSRHRDYVSCDHRCEVDNAEPPQKQPGAPAWPREYTPTARHIDANHGEQHNYDPLDRKQYWI